MKYILYSAFVVALSYPVFSQSNVVATGGDASGSGGSSSYSVGQIDYANNSGSNGSENQGVQQPYEFFTVSISETEGVIFSLFPNPTQDELVIQTTGDLSGYQFQLTDMNGKLILTEPLVHSETLVDLENLPSATYHLVLMKNEGQVNTYKIVKH